MAISDADFGRYLSRKKVGHGICSETDKHLVMRSRLREVLNLPAEDGQVHIEFHEAKALFESLPKFIEVMIELKIPAFLGEDYTRVSEYVLESVDSHNQYLHQEGIIPEDLEVTAQTVHVEYPE